MRRNFQAIFALLLAGALHLGACANSDPGTTGAAGTSGAAGTGAAGTGAAGMGAAGTGAAGTGAAGTGAAGTGAAGTGVAGTGVAGTGAAGAGVAGTGVAGAGAAGTGVAGAGAAGTGAAGAGAAGTGAAGAGTPVKTLGCGKQVTDSPTQWTTHDIMVTTVAAAYKAAFTNRRYWTRPPPNYDPMKAYPLTIWGQGCGQGGSPENTPMTLGPAAANSIQVEILASQNAGAANKCYSAGPDGDHADSPELPYFDQVLSEVEAEFCVDKNKVWVGGYSSGGWFSSLISCNRASVVKGVGWAAAGLQNNHDPCVGPVPALITRGTNDNGTQLSAAMLAVESLRMRNGCAATSKPWMPVWGATEAKADTSACVLYDNCMPGYPLVWCPTPGGHTNTEGDTKLTRLGLWKLWTSLP